MNINLPAELSEDTGIEVLFVKPYTASQQQDIEMALDPDDALKKTFAQVTQDDPGLERFQDYLTVIIWHFGLKGWAEEDIVIISGDKEQLAQAQAKISEERQYHSFFSTVQDFLDHVETEGPVVVKGPAVN